MAVMYIFVKKPFINILAEPLPKAMQSSFSGSKEGLVAEAPQVALGVSGKTRLTENIVTK